MANVQVTLGTAAGNLSKVDAERLAKLLQRSLRGGDLVLTKDTTPLAIPDEYTLGLPNDKFIGVGEPPSVRFRVARRDEKSGVLCGIEVVDLRGEMLPIQRRK